MNFIKPVLFLTAVLFLMSATTCMPEGTDTGNPFEDNYGQCGTVTQSGTISASCVPNPAPLNHAGQTCKKLNSCFNQIDRQTCYEQVVITPGLSKEIAIDVDTFNELFRLYSKEKTIIYDGKLYDTCLEALQKISCDDPLIQNAVTFDDGKVDYSSVHSLIHVDPSCKLIYSFK